MGTRADFYVGTGPEAEWIGSIPWDGYPDGIPVAIRVARNEPIYRELVGRFVAEGGTTADMGWPWPWEDSRTTDWAYCFTDGVVLAFNWGLPVEFGKDPGWPDMSASKAVTYGPRSGLIVLEDK